MIDCIRREDAENLFKCDLGEKDQLVSKQGVCIEAVFRLESIPAADVVDRAQYDELLKAARAMHTWIFLHTADEEDAYSKCGLTDEINTLLGYCGEIEVRNDPFKNMKT